MKIIYTLLMVIFWSLTITFYGIAGMYLVEVTKPIMGIFQAAPIGILALKFSKEVYQNYKKYSEN